MQFWPSEHCNLDLGNMTLILGHDTFLSQEQQLCEVALPVKDQEQ